MAGLSVVIILIIWWFRRKSGTPFRIIYLPPWILASIQKFCLLVLAIPIVAILSSLASQVPFLPAATADTVIVALSVILSIVFCWPVAILEWVVVPLRLPRVAYWIGRLCLPVSFAGESVACGVIYGALAMARQGASDRQLDWLGRKLYRPKSLRGGGVVAAGLLAALRGDRPRACSLMFVADALPSQFVSRKARAIARDWLIVDAARAANLREVIRLGRRRRPTLRWSYTIARIAERLVGDKQAPPGWLLMLCWMLSPRRRANLPLLRRALATPRRLDNTIAEETVPADLPQALADLAKVCEHGDGNGARLVAAIDGLRAALDRPGTRDQIEQRLAALGAQPDADAIVAGFRDGVVDLVAELLEARPSLAVEARREPMVEQAIARVRTRTFRDIEAQCKDYEVRTKSGDALDQIAEWETWAMLRHSADRLLELDPAAEAGMFETMWPVCNNFAVFQHNVCKRLPLAYEIYSWLHKHGQHIPSASQLAMKNMRAASIK